MSGLTARGPVDASATARRLRRSVLGNLAAFMNTPWDVSTLERRADSPRPLLGQSTTAVKLDRKNLSGM
jgi:hypothetical protein